MTDLHFDLGLAGCLEGLVGVALANQQFDLAARLGGATSAWRMTKQMARTAAEQATFDDNVAAARQALGTDVFTQSWQDGEAMTLAQALAATDRLLNTS